MVQTPMTPGRTEVAYAPGIITGRVVFDGVAPVRSPVPGVNLMPECEKAHGGPIYDESLVVNADGTLANVVVSVSSGLGGWLREEFPPPAEPAVLNQKGCVFEPHVVALMVGEPLLIKNSDPMLHNVHVMAVNNPNANLGQPTIGETATEPFESPEVFRVKCDVHPWMSAWVRVLDNPYFAVTGRDGRFTVRGLPPGTYTLKAWHEQLGVRELQVTIGPDRGAGVDFTFKPIQ
jgi:plastocyanin